MKNNDNLEEKSKQLIKSLENLVHQYPELLMSQESEVEIDALILREVMKDYDNGLFKNIISKYENGENAFFVQSGDIEISFQLIKKRHHIQWFSLKTQEHNYTYNETTYHIFGKLFNKQPSLIELINKTIEKLEATSEYMKAQSIFTGGFNVGFIDLDVIEKSLKMMIEYTPYPEKLIIPLLSSLPKEIKKLAMGNVLSSIEHEVNVKEELNNLYSTKIEGYLEAVAHRKAEQYNNLVHHHRRNGHPNTTRTSKDYGYSKYYKINKDETIENLTKLIDSHNFFYQLKKDVEEVSKENKSKMKI